MLHFLVLSSGENASVLALRVREAGATLTSAETREEAEKLLSFVERGLLMQIDGVIIDSEFEYFDCTPLPTISVSISDPEPLVAYISKIQESYERESTIDEPMLKSLRLRWIERAGEYADILRQVPETPSYEKIEEVRRISHTIRGTAESFGFRSIGVVATSVEEAIKRGELHDKLHAATRELLRALEEIQA